jgi:hypothetical protein
MDISIWAALGMLIGFYGTFLGGLAILVLVFSHLGSISPNVTGYLLIATIGLLLWYGTGLILADALGYIMVHQILGQFILLATVGYIAWSWYQNRRKSKGDNFLLS